MSANRILIAVAEAQKENEAIILEHVLAATDTEYMALDEAKAEAKLRDEEAAVNLAEQAIAILWPSSAL